MIDSNLIAELRKIGDAYLDEFPTFKAQEICPQAADALEAKDKEIAALKVAIAAMMPLNIAAALNSVVAERDRLTAELVKAKGHAYAFDVAVAECESLEAERDRLAKRVEELERERKTWG